MVRSSLCSVSPAKWATASVISVMSVRGSGDVACIAVAQPSDIKVEHPCEEGDEDGHAGVTCQHIVHATDDALWLCLTLCQQPEGTADSRHEQCGRNTLACYIANAEVESVVVHEVVVKVTTYLLGRGHRGVELQLSTQRRDLGVWQYRHLDIAGNRQLALDGRFPGGCSLQLSEMSAPNTPTLRPVRSWMGTE